MSEQRVDLGQMSIDHVEAIGNGDIINLVAIIDTGLRQFSVSPSASTQSTHSADVAIAKNLVAFFKQRFGHFSGQPELYMPRAHPKPKALPNPPVVNIVENPDLQNLMYSLSELRTELLHCNDSERSNGFHKNTVSTVVEPWISKAELFVKLMEDNLENSALTWYPDVDLQEPPVNPGPSPR